MIYPQNRSNQTCGYSLITSDQQTLCCEINIFLTVSKLQVSEWAITKQQAVTKKLR